MIYCDCRECGFCIGGGCITEPEVDENHACLSYHTKSEEIEIELELEVKKEN